jgi:hypothetical protein
MAAEVHGAWVLPDPDFGTRTVLCPH